MDGKIGFDNDKYLEKQSIAILERVKKYDNKLYLEFGGKLIFDYHASRVLPGFDPNVKIKLLQQLKNEADIILCIYAGDIERRKIRADFGITYDADAMKLIDDLRSWGIDITAVVITRYNDQPAVNIFKNKLERRGINVFTHRFTKGYPNDVDAIVSEEGYGANPYIPTEKPLVIVTASSPVLGSDVSQAARTNANMRRSFVKVSLCGWCVVSVDKFPPPVAFDHDGLGHKKKSRSGGGLAAAGDKQ